MKVRLLNAALLSALSLIATSVPAAEAQKVENIKYGDFSNWVTRHIKESGVIGGNQKTIYEIGPNATINGASAYTPTGGSPWATSNVYAKVMGITKTSNAVFPDTRDGGNRCAKLTTVMEHCKAIGMIDIDVVVAGTIFLGRMYEPIKSTSNPMSKMEMGVPFTKRPKALRFDYKLTIPNTNQRTYSSGLSKQKTLQGHDNAEIFLLLQRRWEDEKGNLHAKRVGTARQLYSKSTNGWVNKHEMTISYGDITGQPWYKKYMGLIAKDKSYYARNSKGKLVPVIEEGWDDANATPTHMLMMFSAGSGEPYVGTLGLTLWIDNVSLVY